MRIAKVRLFIAFFAGIFVGAAFPRPARAYFGPDLGTSKIGSSAQIGSGFFLQTVEYNNRFLSKDQKFMEQEQETFQLAWMLGYAYYRSSAHDPASGTLIYDEAHAIKLGLAWGVGDFFDLTLAGAYQVIPAENYSQGIYDIGVDFTIPLVKRSEAPINGSSEDASIYYQSLERAKERIRLSPTKTFPNLKIGFQTEFQIHTKSPTTSGRTAGSSLTSDQTLPASALGPDLVLHTSPWLKFRLAAMFYFYGSPPSQILANTTIGGVRSKVDLSVADFEGTLPFLLLFPQHTFSGSGTFELNRVVNLSLLAEEAGYTATGSAGAGLLTSTFSIGAVLDWMFGPRWNTGFVADYTTGDGGYAEASGGLKLGFTL